jgi:hypothetical protein
MNQVSNNPQIKSKIKIWIFFTDSYGDQYLAPVELLKKSEEENA